MLNTILHLYWPQSKYVQMQTLLYNKPTSITYNHDGDTARTTDNDTS